MLHLYAKRPGWPQFLYVICPGNLLKWNNLPEIFSVFIETVYVKHPLSLCNHDQEMVKHHSEVQTCLLAIIIQITNSSWGNIKNVFALCKKYHSKSTDIWAWTLKNIAQISHPQTFVLWECLITDNASLSCYIGHKTPRIKVR